MHGARKHPSAKNAAGIIKPDIVFFGEALPEEALARSEQHARKADLMLVLGSSLTVYPAAAIPEVTLQCGGKTRHHQRFAYPS